MQTSPAPAIVAAVDARAVAELAASEAHAARVAPPTEGVDPSLPLAERVEEVGDGGHLALLIKITSLTAKPPSAPPPDLQD